MADLETQAWQLALIEGMPQMIWRAVGHGSWTWSSPQWQKYTGQDKYQSAGNGWLEVVHPDDHAAARAAWSRVDQDEVFHVDLRIRAPDGAYRWFQTNALPIRDRDGAIVEWIGTSTDVDELRQLQEEQKILVTELQHRTRNLIAVVHAIALQTVQQSLSLDEFEERFENRLSALSRVQGLLSRSEHEPITIGKLIELELSALADPRGHDRVSLSGPDIPIRSAAVQTLALAIHELCTNALKYGALSHPLGRLGVTWHEHYHDEEQTMRVEWIESGLPASHRPGSDKIGYGRILIEQSLPQQLGAATAMTFDGGGVRCVIDLPFRHYGIVARHA
ncbi:sensor histidine kinase [Sphingomonas mollis]|uniref:histidine kinase n=1 Tax=Sphingomonas mollis TaxID=2795726 RepID=A0ABS0XTV6_9SPHN|nr:HWE histidine kinase domain-containing protein [Sphingomonas sp. BT553]MBJ6123458.1 PAS domain-containing protein [Sphingomonas sp. BT553]